MVKPSPMLKKNQISDFNKRRFIDINNLVEYQKYGNPEKFAYFPHCLNYIYMFKTGIVFHVSRLEN